MGDCVTNLRPLFDYYQRELNYLRYQGSRFATQYPKIAQRLDFGASESSDPHVERLLESFSYLTARLQRDIDDQFPRIATGMLEVLYPHFINPLPSMTIAKFVSTPDKGKLTEVTKIPRKTPLFCQTLEGETCRFETAYDIELAPISLKKAEIISRRSLDLPSDILTSTNCLLLRFETFGMEINRINLKKLRFYLSGNSILQANLYEALFAQETEIAVIPGGLSAPENLQLLPQDSLYQVGFLPDEAVIPYPSHAHAGYRLIYEYFHFPEKFLYAEIQNLHLTSTAKSFDILITLADDVFLSPNDINEMTFQLHTTPVTNIFRKTSEPLKLDYRAHETRLVADFRREKTTEIHSIETVKAVFENREEVHEFAPYFSYNHNHVQREQKAFWSARRIPAMNPKLSGTDILLSFVDFEMNPQRPPSHIIYAEVLCTNRMLAQQLPAGSILQPENETPASHIYCLDKPTPQTSAPLEGDALWRLISHLSLIHLTLSNDPASLEALKEIMRLYSNTEHLPTPKELKALVGMSTELVTRRIGLEAWRGFLQGTKVSLTFDKKDGEGGNLFLFSSVMNHFLSLFAAVNSFTELEIINKNRKGIWKQWPSISGSKRLV